MTFEELRKKHPRLCYKEYSYQIEGESLRASYLIELGSDISFRPEIEIPISGDSLVEAELLDNLVAHLGLVECISYWKAACPPVIDVQALYLNDEQISWWKNLLLHGLGEFFYCNGIDCSNPDLVKIICAANQLHLTPSKSQAPKTECNPLILVGGGKDSAVSLELLHQHFPKANCFLLNPSQSFFRTSQQAGFEKAPLVAKRTIDPKLIELNKSGYLNGHTPFSAYLAFLSTIVAYLNGHDQIIASNESSADEENVLFNGISINHQYSKSFDFEKRFRNYERSYLGTGTSYLSFLRPIHEIQIAMLFSQFENQHKDFRSCNRGQRNDKWCAECPKCAFVYLMLYPFLSHQKVLSIFGADLFLNSEIQTHLEANISPEAVKPFECVGSKSEALLALALSIQKRENAGIDTPEVLLTLLEKNRKLLDASLLDDWNKNNFLDEKLKNILQQALEQQLPSPVLVYGLGKEGSSTRAFLSKHHPNTEVIVCDKGKDGINEQEFIEKNIIISTLFRSPGIPLHSPVIEHARSYHAKMSSLSNLFFSKVPGKVVGITGTKGKSTTASLVHHMLETKYKDVRLVGNIGVPALDLLEGANADSLFVYELSSFQLEDLERSPSISVLLDIYPEHLDHHRDFKSYRAAKCNIFAQQKGQDYLITSTENESIISKEHRGQRVLFANKQKHFNGLSHFENALFENGELVFNFGKTLLHPSNIVAASSVARLLDVPWESIQQSISTFSPLPHRLENIGIYKGITYINDSLSTIPQATHHAIETLGPQLSTLIVGGFDRGITFESLGKRIADSDINNLILLPTTGEKIWNSIPAQARSRINKFIVTSMEEAVSRVYQHCNSDEICLLSPASSSLNLFRDYQDRGQQFRHFVQLLGE